MTFLLGPQNADWLILMIRLTLGTFFVLTRFRWFYDPSRPDWPFFNGDRRKHLEWKLNACGYGCYGCLSWLAAMVAWGEMLGALGLIVGLFTPFAALGLAVLLFFATLCTAREKVLEQQPIDTVDCVSCYLWRIEGPYLIAAIGLFLSGGGRFSLDYLIFG